MDEIDRNIAVALQEDGSSGLAELAKVAGLSVSATAERVKRLAARGGIRGGRGRADGRAGVAGRARGAGLPVPATAERVKRLEERGVIRGWRADLDPAA